MTELIKKLIRNQGIRYIFFGGCTTGVNLISYAILRLVLGVDMTMANFIAILLAIVFAYGVNKVFVFESRTKGAAALFKEFASFVGMRLSTMFLEIFGVVFMSCLFGVPEMAAKLLIQVVVLVLNYVFSKLFVFSDKKREPVNPVTKKCCILGFAIPAVTVIIAFAANGVFPFGDRGVLIIDSLHQYLPFFTEFREKLVDGGSLRYSFGGGLGFNFWATYAYYLASPLNFLIVLFPKRHVMDAMALFIVLKIGLCGLTSAWYFSKKSRGKTYTPVLFSVMFALSSFIIGYYFNLMWLDSIAMLPLMMMGIERIVRGEKANLYCLSLFYGLYCNYYIGFMLCLFACLYFLVTWIAARSFEIRKFFASCFNFGWHSLLAGGMAAVVLVPAYVALGITESAENSFPEKIDLFVKDLSQLTSQFAYCEPINIADDQIGVNAFCGTLVLILTVLFLLDRKICLRERIAKVLLLLLLGISFDVNVLNYIWHGFHVQNGLPNRFAFIYIFFMLTLAFDAWRHLERFSPKRVLPAVILPLAFAVYAAVTGLGERALYTYLLTIALLAVYGMLLFLYRMRAVSKLAFRSIFLGLGMLEMISFGVYGICCNGTVGRSTYLDEQKAYEKMIVAQEEEGFFRSEIDSNRMRNENMFLGADGVVLFSSTMPAATVDLCRSLGIEARTNKNGYNGYTKLMNDVFGVKYVISSNESDRLYQMEQVAFEDPMYLYKNSGALSLGFMVRPDIREWDTESRNHFQVQNEFVRLATGYNGLFVQKESIEMEDGETYNVVLPAGEQIYLDVTASVEKIEITTPEYTKTYNTYNDHLYDLGCFDAITYATVTCTFKENQTGPVLAEVWSCSQEEYEKVHEKLAALQLVQSRVEDGRVCGTVNVEKAGVLLLTIPYEKGWSVKVDGEKKKFFSVGNALTGIELEEGEHTLEMIYTPDGLWVGTALSLLCIALYLLTKAGTDRLYAKRAAEQEAEELQEQMTEELQEQMTEELQEQEAEELQEQMAEELQEQDSNIQDSNIIEGTKKNED